MSNKFDIYSSKVKRVNIPIPAFKFFHKASSEEEVDPKFIGREQISDKLYSWLKEDPAGGSYLVTGFRGMGKSSFVGHVLNKLVRRTTMIEYIAGVAFFLSVIIDILCVIYGWAVGFWGFSTVIIFSLCYIRERFNYGRIAYKKTGSVFQPDEASSFRPRHKHFDRKREYNKLETCLPNFTLR